ncbi:MarR family transcriptional regulator (plasmid) [Priestia aryabhattai]
MGDISRESRLARNFEKFLKNAHTKYQLIGKENNISISQCVILEILNDSGPNKVTELADKMDITPSAITSLTEKLINSGFIVRERCDEDRRIVRLVITSLGKSFLTKIVSRRNKMIRSLHSNLSVEETDMLIKIYQKLASNKM